MKYDFVRECFTFEPGEVGRVGGLVVHNLNAEEKTLTRQLIECAKMGEVFDGIQVTRESKIFGKRAISLEDI